MSDVVLPIPSSLLTKWAVLRFHNETTEEEWQEIIDHLEHIKPVLFPVLSRALLMDDLLPTTNEVED